MTTTERARERRAGGGEAMRAIIVL